jgi:ribosomal protein S18 acetylase RimI-like enzyme
VANDATFPVSRSNNRRVCELRDAVPGDELAVAQVHVRAWQAGYHGLLPDEYLDGLRAEERAQRYTFHLTDVDHPATTVALNQSGEICGFVTTGPSRDAVRQPTGEVYALHVDPNWWGQGVGRALISAARSRLVDIGAIEADLWVLDGNSRAERFYRHNGWESDGQQRPEVVWGVSVIENRYRATLSGTRS